MYARLARPAEEDRYSSEGLFLERTTGFEGATPTLAIVWRMSHASPPVSPVPLSCAFLALLSHPSHQIAGVDSISLVISLVLPPTADLSLEGEGDQLGPTSRGALQIKGPRA
jgi:hypothetical protein